jgi:DNA-binding IclR family transcriptional regulator
VESGGIQSIVRAFAMLEVIAQARDGIGLSDLSRKVGIHNSTTFNLVRTMAALGYIWQSNDDKRYRIGRPILCLTASAVDDMWLANKATEVLGELSQATGETGHFAVWAGHKVAVLAKTSGAGAFQLADGIGAERPAYATALGKMLLSSLPPGGLDRYFKSTVLTALTSRTITSEKRLREEIARVSRSGIAYDNGEFDEEVRCVAVPVPDFTGRTAGALGLSGPIWRMTDQAIQKKAVLLRKAAERLGRELGDGGLSAEYSPALERLGGVGALPKKASVKRKRAGSSTAGKKARRAPPARASSGYRR